MIKSFYKKVILLIADAIIISVSIWLSFLFRLDYYYSFTSINKFIFAIYFIIFFICYSYFNIYKIIIRFIDYHSILKIIKATFFAQCILIVVNIYFYNYIFFPRTISFIAPEIIVILTILSRILMSFLVNSKDRFIYKKRNVVIYGINKNTVLFSQSLRNLSFIFNVIGFINNKTEFKEREVNGIEILKFDNDLINILKEKKVTDLFFLDYGIDKKLDNYFFEIFTKLNIRIVKLPSDNISFIDFITGKRFVNKKYDINFNDIVNRPKIKVKNTLLKKKFFNKTVLVTGAGGSIGFELSLQIAQLKPKKLVLLDISELNLFNIFNKIKSIKNFNSNKVELILGDCSDSNFISNFLNKYQFDEIYHAAAYKHVKFLEENIFSAIKNNIFGTLNIVNFAIKNKVKNFVFISTDKAVNPKSVLGITKKIGEMIVEYHCRFKKINLNYLVVRFGNVVGSSGSAIPLFLEQVKKGEKVIVKNKKTKRYFMSIEEAIELVLYSSLINKNFNIYALDMGEQIRIYDVARRIIQLCGLNIKNKKHQNGDIFIEINSLDKGEKIKEELVLGNNLKKTSHPKIYLCEEKNNYNIMPKIIAKLNNSSKNNKISKNFILNLINQ
jgi:FlaA1/EpsC-like NDP-sugar epimerase